MFNLFRKKSVLFPEIEPYATGMLDVGNGHHVYYEESGNPHGTPVIYCHGGPGAASKPKHRRLFDPKRYRIILFDQRGCGKSTPANNLEHNTTQHLIADMEQLHQHLDIQKWHVFGGSWGSTLALAYAQAQPDVVKSLMIYGVFTARQSDMDNLYSASGVAAKLFPDIFAPYQNYLPKVEQNAILTGYIKRILTTPSKTRKEAARAFTAWEMNLLSIQPDKTEIDATLNHPGFNETYALINLHYFKNKCFLKEAQILKNMKKIRHIPLSIVQGRYDVVCPPITAWEIHQAHGRSNLNIVGMAGHSMSDAEMTKYIVDTTNAHAGL